MSAHGVCSTRAHPMTLWNSLPNISSPVDRVSKESAQLQNQESVLTSPLSANSNQIQNTASVIMSGMTLTKMPPCTI